MDYFFKVTLPMTFNNVANFYKYLTKLKTKLIILIAGLIMALPAMAQLRKTAAAKMRTYQSMADSIQSKYIDSLNILKHQLDSISAMRNNTNDTRLLANPYYYRLFVNPMLYRRPLHQVMSLATPGSEVSPLVADQRLIVDRNINNFFANMYVAHPEIINQTDSVLQNSTGVRKDINETVTHTATVSEIVKPKELETVIEPIEAVSRRPNFWTFKGNVSTQLQQFYYSDNWYQGGTNYNSMIITSWLTLNYNNKQKIMFENKLEMNLGFQTNKDDKEHKFKTNTDLLRLTNKLGIQASKHWYYTISLQSWTQFYPKYHNNTNNVYSDFLSPLECVLSIGMDYKLNKKNFNLSVIPAPLSYDFKYVDRNSLVNNYGTRGHHSMETIGSNITCNMTWKPFKELTWTSRLFYFTNYHMAKVEWENTFAFSINKYLNTKLHLYPRFDDSYHSNKSDALIQFKEYLSLGFNYNF